MKFGLKISEVARAAKVNVETLRYYERIGLLAEPPRRPRSRYRMYPDSAVSTVRFIKRAQELGFSLGEVSELLGLGAVSPSGLSGAACSDVNRLACQKIAVLEAKISDLQRMRSALIELSKSCVDGDLACPIIEAITAEGDIDE